MLANSADTGILERRIRVALGQEPGDLLLRGGKIVNVFTCEVQDANVVTADGWIAGVGPYEWSARDELDLDGRTILPGLIDAHMHLESTLLMPGELAQVLAPHGTSVVIADPHEIGNVLGIPGIDLLLSASEGLPLDFYFMAPSCVPATAWEDNGATLDAAAVRELLGKPRILGLAEVMDFPAVLSGNTAVLDKIRAAVDFAAAIDGHAPGVVGRNLVAYAAAGIRSDHESTQTEEALQKARLGMLVQVREGSSAHNLDALLPLIVAGKLGDWCLATDDVHPDDLQAHGHLDYLLRRVVSAGVPAAKAVRHATLVPARHYGLSHRGAVAPGYRADLAVVDDLTGFRPRLVVHDGTIVARDGELIGGKQRAAATYANTIHVGALDESAFELHLSRDEFPVIGIVPDQIVTRFETHSVKRSNGHWEFDAGRDIALVACIERHRATGRVGLGLVRGFQFGRHGALGSSVGHDSHNLIVAGTNARDMLTCVRALERLGGGYVAAAGGEILAELPLRVAGLVSEKPVDEVVRELNGVLAAAKSLGCPLHSPFGTLSFLALPVIPELRVTDQGLFDVRTGRMVVAARSSG